DLRLPEDEMSVPTDVGTDAQ
ncbi:ribosome silencing factor, partial [Cutibacterium acnes subsp. acnes]|nr:ribosome silencing factor [Cutibacterium acnes subsp. acnes]